MLLFQVCFCLRNESLKLKTHLLAVPFTPATHLTEHRLDALPQFGQGIFDLWGHLRIDVPVKDPACSNSRNCIVSICWVAWGRNLRSSLKRLVPLSKENTINGFHLPPMIERVTSTG
jgi:hypothetical protein